MGVALLTTNMGTSAGILFTDGKKILLLKRAQGGDNPGTWGLPGGKEEQGENELETAHREVKEECGISHIPGVRVCDLPQSEWMTFLYQVDGPFKEIKLSNEHTAWSWIALGDLTTRNLHPKFREQLPRYLRAIRKNLDHSFREWAAIESLLLSLGLKSPVFELN